MIYYDFWNIFKIYFKEMTLFLFKNYLEIYL